MSRTTLAQCFLLVLITILPYHQVGEFEFLNLDDDGFITNDPILQRGVWGMDAWKWAWTKADPFIMPVVRLTFLLESSLVGLDAGWFHRVNVLFHLANVLLLWGLWRQWTGDSWRAWLVAALFAVHPQHVEAVAWVSERKEVMSAFFGLLCLWSYTRYARTSGWGWYLASLGGMLVSLLCKPLWVTLPVLLLLLDYWPLQRVQAGWWFLIREKLPFLAIGTLVAGLTVFSTYQGGHLTDTQVLPLINRLANMVWGYAGYLTKTIWPVSLGIPYRVEATPPEWTTLLVLAGGVILTVGAWHVRRTIPILPVAWAWLLISLLPVSGILEGGQPLLMADRRSYLPHMLLLASLVWMIPRPGRPVVITAWTAVISLLMIQTAGYAQYWRTSHTLWGHFQEIHFEKDYAHWNMARALMVEGRWQEASEQALQAHRLDPGEAAYLVTLGEALHRQGKVDQAWQTWSFLIHTRSPTTFAFLHDLGLRALQEKRHDSAVLLLGQAWQMRRQDLPSLAWLLGLALMWDGQQNLADEVWQTFLQPNPSSRCSVLRELALRLEQEGLGLPTATARIQELCL